MILVVTSAEFKSTHGCLDAERDKIDVRVASWDEVVNAPPVKASYILTDFDRLSPWELHLASQFYLDVVKARLPVLNNPARVASRAGLLRRLYRRGVNQFNAYRCEEVVRPERWPVFVRSEGHHGPVLTELIYNMEDLQQNVTRCMQAGIPISHLLIIEYAAEPYLPGLFRKLSVFRVGERSLGYTCVIDDQWVVKHGKKGISPPEAFEEEYLQVRDNPFGETVRRAFNIAGIEYGRVDFGLVDGKPQIYEINSNPELALRPPTSQHARRNESTDLFRDNFLAALKAIDLD